MENWYIGTDLKFEIELTSSGFSMDDDDWTISVKSANKIVQEIPKSDCVKEQDGKWYVFVNAEYLKKGDLELVAHAYVPDEHFNDGYRDEVDKVRVGRMNKV